MEVRVSLFISFTFFSSLIERGFSASILGPETLLFSGLLEMMFFLEALFTSSLVAIFLSDVENRDEVLGYEALSLTSVRAISVARLLSEIAAFV